MKNFSPIYFHAGKPTPEIKWEKDGEILVESSSLLVENGKSSSTVHIPDARRVHSGQYVLHLKNIGGMKSLGVSVKVLDSPGPPETVTVSDISAGRVRVSWKPPTDNGGANVTHYVVEKRETSRLTWTLIDSNVSLSKDNCSIFHLPIH